MGGRVRFPVTIRSCAFAALAAGLLCAGAALVSKAVDPAMRGTVQLNAGDSADLDGEVLTLDGFRILRYPSGKVRQYESDVRILDPKNEVVVKTTISVNHPLRRNGFWVYQYGCDPDGSSTVLLAIRDKTLPLAATGGVLLLLGSFLIALTSFTASWEEPPAGKVARWFRRTAGVLVALPPVFIVGRALLRPEPIPALQSPLMAPHVAAYVAGYLLLLFATFGAGRRWVPVGFFFITLGLVLGAVWGKICWGDFWQYDPKEMWALATWFAYGLCLVFARFPKIERVLLVAGAVLILLTLTWVNFSKLFKGLHSYA